MRPLSLRARFGIGFAAVAIVLVVVGVAIVLITSDRLIAEVDNRLVDASIVDEQSPLTADDLLVMATADDTEGDAGTSGSVGPCHRRLPGRDVGDGDDDDHCERPSDRASDVYEGVLNADGVLTTLFSPNVGETGTPQLSGTFERATFVTIDSDGEADYRAYVQPIDGGANVTAIPINEVDETISRLVWVQVLGSALVLAVLALVGWWLNRLGLRPIRSMTQTATAIAAGDLDRRVPSATSATEAGQLGVALNHMLEHIDDALSARERSEQQVRQFVADASHELRTPITTIRGYAELYQMGGLSNADDLDDAMRRTAAESARMGRLVDDMLTLARLDQQPALRLREVDLATVVRDCVADASVVAPERSITASFADGLAEDAMVVSADEDRVRQVVANVIGNALVHTDDGIEVTVDRDDDTVRVRVVDHGSGMPAAVAERVTERFFRADVSRSRHRGGSGLGLSIVETTMVAFGGTVTVLSEEGVGTTIELRFPPAPLR